jgi:hypothetical protein
VHDLNLNTNKQVLLLSGKLVETDLNCFGSGFKWVSESGFSQAKMFSKKGKGKIFLSFLIIKNLGMHLDWILINSLDPDPDSLNRDPKHC